jgi:hypothetical protein
MAHIRTEHISGPRVCDPTSQESLDSLVGLAKRWISRSDGDAKQAFSYIDRIRGHVLWKRKYESGNNTWEDFCEDCLGRPAEYFEWVRIGIECADGTVSIKDAARLGEQVSAARANPLSPNGGDRKSKAAKSNQFDNVKLKGGNDTGYTLRRLSRDGHHDLLNKIERKELTVNQAAVAAGYRRRSVSVPSDDANRAIAALLKHYSREQLLEAIGFATSLSCQERQNNKIEN